MNSRIKIKCKRCEKIIYGYEAYPTARNKCKKELPMKVNMKFCRDCWTHLLKHDRELNLIIKQFK